MRRWMQRLRLRAHAWYGHIHSSLVIMPCLVYNVSIMPCQVCCCWPLQPSRCLKSDLSWGDVSSLCLNCSRSPVILFPTPWLMIPLKFIFMLNLVMILCGTQLFTDGSYPFAAWSLGAIFRGILWNCTRRRKQRAIGEDKTLHFLPRADNWRQLWTWILSDFQCREDPAHNTVLLTRRDRAQWCLHYFCIKSFARKTFRQCTVLISQRVIFGPLEFL